MSESKIIITVNKDGEQDIDIQNMSISYLPYLLGRLMKKAFEDPMITGTDNHNDIRQLKNNALEILGKEMGAESIIEWIPLKDKQPDNTGPFLCKEKGRPTIYTDMYYDMNKKIFGTKEGTGYSFITDWLPMPRERRNINV